MQNATLFIDFMDFSYLALILQGFHILHKTISSFFGVFYSCLFYPRILVIATFICVLTLFLCSIISYYIIPFSTHGRQIVGKKMIQYLPGSGYLPGFLLIIYNIVKLQSDLSMCSLRMLHLPPVLHFWTSGTGSVRRSYFHLLF